MKTYRKCHGEWKISYLGYRLSRVYCTNNLRLWYQWIHKIKLSKKDGVKKHEKLNLYHLSEFKIS